MVPLTGLEPVWYFYRGILSPLCLPISPQRHYNNIYFITNRTICQVPKSHFRRIYLESPGIIAGTAQKISA